MVKVLSRQIVEGELTALSLGNGYEGLMRVGGRRETVFVT